MSLVPHNERCNIDERFEAAVLMILASFLGTSKDYDECHVYQPEISVALIPCEPSVILYTLSPTWQNQLDQK